MQGNSTGFKHKARKRFGQNFLVDNGIIQGIIDASEITENDTVIEIGPGKGALTKEIITRAKRLLAIEIDWDLANYLREEFSGYPNFQVIEGDFLKLDIDEYLIEGENIKVVANLPYYITTPIVMKLLESDISFDSITVMVQKEVGLRMCAKAGSPDYGALSLAVDFYTNPDIVVKVPAGAFRPIPKVDSCVVKMVSKEPLCEGARKEALFRLIKAAFSQRRKTLVNAAASNNIASKDEVKNALISLGFDENIRGERLTLEDFLNISERIGE